MNMNKFVDFKEPPPQLVELRAAWENLFPAKETLFVSIKTRETAKSRQSFDFS